jgi:hypothetical protein
MCIAPVMASTRKNWPSGELKFKRNEGVLLSSILARRYTAPGSVCRDSGRSMAASSVVQDKEAVMPRLDQAVPKFPCRGSECIDQADGTYFNVTKITFLQLR